MSKVKQWKDRFWFPKLVDADYIIKLRQDYPEETSAMDDDTIIDKYCDGQRYATLWDHQGDAYEDFEPLADAFFELLAENEKLRLAMEE